MYDPDNIFAKIIRGEIPCKKVYEDDAVFAFEDAAPAAPVHILAVPKGKYVSFNDFMGKASEGEISAFFKTVRSIAQQCGIVDTGYRVITNHGADASQSVPHFHVHIVGGKPLGGLLPGDINVR